MKKKSTRKPVELRQLLRKDGNRELATYLWAELTRDYRPKTRNDRDLCLRIIGLVLRGILPKEDVGDLKLAMRDARPASCWAYCQATVRCYASDRGCDFDTEARLIELTGCPTVNHQMKQEPTRRERRIAMYATMRKEVNRKRDVVDGVYNQLMEEAAGAKPIRRTESRSHHGKLAKTKDVIDERLRQLNLPT